MSPVELTRSAIGNSVRSKTRTTLTVVAIFLGAFTLTLTSAVGTGVNRYIDTTLASIGAADVLTVTRAPAQSGSGPVKYDPNKKIVQGDSGPGGNSGIVALNPKDLTRIAAVPGVLSVQPTLTVQPDFVRYNSGTAYQASAGSITPGMNLELAAGHQPSGSSAAYQVAIPTTYVSPLGLGSAARAVGKTIGVAVTDARGHQSTVAATVIGVSRSGLLGGDSITPNEALTQRLYNLQSVGMTTADKQSYAEAAIRVSSTATGAQVAAIKTHLADRGYLGETVADRIGTFQTVINAVILILNGFAVIALLAAGFGIVNTLLMSVQERTREIGLMKAMGMSSRSVFGLFSLEAVFIGFLGSAVGIGLGLAAGAVADAVLGTGLLAGLPGLTLVGFDPVGLGTIALIVIGIALLAGTIPAVRAARQDPIQALSYE